MKIWKILGIAVISVALMALVGCGQAEQEAEPEPEVEPVVEEVVAVDYTPTAEEIGTEITCGVCGMTMAVTAEMPAVKYGDETFYFCTAEEKASFVAEPEKYLTPAEETEGETN